VSNEILPASLVTEETRPLGSFLFSYLRDLGVRHCFGMPGDYVLPLFKALEETPGIEAVVSTHEPCAAFSADAYARCTGLGVLLVTYGVGGFNAINGVACAYAESSPVLVVSGGRRHRSTDTETYFSPAAHHFVKHPSSQLEVFSQVTDMAMRVDSPETAAPMIRKAATHALKVKRPVYLEIPTDLMDTVITTTDQKVPEAWGYQEIMAEAVSFFLDRIQTARNPILLVGAEIGRHGLQGQVRQIMAARNAPVATSVLGKGIFRETEEGLLGVYAGVISQPPEIREVVEEADLVVMLGVKVTDVNCGIFTADLRRDRILIAKSGWVGDGYKRFSEEIPLDQFVTLLAEEISPVESSRTWPKLPAPDYSRSDILMDRYLAVINANLDEGNVIIADTGDSCYGSLFMTAQRDNGYLAPTFYNTMGFAVPAALGAQLADPESRPIVLVGDGAFQMTGLEMSNLVKWGLDPIIILFNNSGYGMQRIFVDGEFNNIQGWDYTRIVDLVGGGRAWRVTSAEEMQNALQGALEFSGGPSLIEAVAAKAEISTGLQRLGQVLQREKTGTCPLNEDTVPCNYQDRCGFCRATIWK
jgi:indolepyruvate decarboxylase